MKALRSIDELLRDHAFFAGMDPEWLSLIAGCGENVVYQPGAVIAREGQDANEFFAVRRGKVAVEVYAPGQGPLTIDTLGDGAIVGWSWIMPPHRWIFDIRAIETTRAVHFDAACLRSKCEESPAMGYEFIKRFAAVVTARLSATRLQLLDVYGERTREPGSP